MFLKGQLLAGAGHPVPQPPLSPGETGTLMTDFTEEPAEAERSKLPLPGRTGLVRPQGTC